MDDILYALYSFRIFNILCKLHFIGHRNISQLMFSGILSKKNTMSLCEFSKWRNSYSNVEWSFLDPQGTDTVHCKGTSSPDFYHLTSDICQSHHCGRSIENHK